MLPETAATRESTAVRRGFEDGLGRRYRPAARLHTDAPLEILCFRHEITDVPAFDFALRERVARLSDFQHPGFAHIRKVDRLNDERGTVVLMSDGVAGVRLIEILKDVERTGNGMELDEALHLVRQLVSAVAAFHRHAHTGHGAIAPERLFVAPDGQLVIAEYALGAAIEQLKYSRERYWKELRVALPMDAGPSRFDERADLMQIGMVALSLILARPLRDDEYPGRLEDLIGSASARRTGDTPHPLPLPLREWLKRMLQLEGGSSFHSVLEAEAALGEWPSGETLQTPEPDLTVETAGTEMSDERAQEIDDEEEAMRSAQTGASRPYVKWIAAAAVVVAATTGVLFAARSRLSPAVPPMTTGTMVVNTDPPGADVMVDGTPRGKSPITLSLPAGAHTLVVQGHGDARTIPVTITAGAEVSQYLDLPKAGSSYGQLQVRTDPAGARISIDGTPLGKTPMTIVEIAPGEHTVTVESDVASITQKVMIEAGVPASLVVPMGTQPGAVASGWVSVSAPVVMDLRENGRLLGNSGIDRIMLPAGKHEIELVNEQIGYRETRTLQVVPGRVAAVSVTLPTGTVSLNAVPWASVSIDGENIGDTPIGNFPLAVGQHEVVFRNSELGEQRRVITVTLHSPLRLSVDLRKK